MSFESSGNKALLKIRNSNIRLSRSAMKCPNPRDKVFIERSPSRPSSQLSGQDVDGAETGIKTDLPGGLFRSKTMPVKLTNMTNAIQNSDLEIILTTPDGQISRCSDDVYKDRENREREDKIKEVLKCNESSRLSSVFDEAMSITSDGDYSTYSSDDQSSDYDTDLEENDSGPKYDRSQQRLYQKMCEDAGLTPSSAFMRGLSTQAVNISHSMLESKDIKLIATSLVNNATVLKLNVSDNDIGAEGTVYIAEALMDNVYLTDLNLSEINIGKNNVIGLRKLVDSLLHNKTVTKLNLSGNHLGSKHADDLARLIKRNDYLVKLDLSKNDLDEAAASKLENAIASNLALKKLNLSWNHLRKNGATTIIKAISNNVELLHADLSWNGLGSEGSRAIQNDILKNKTLKSLDISHNRIGFQDVGMIIKGLHKNECLKTLKIQGNPITTEGAIALMKMCENSPSCGLSELYLNDVPANEEFMECVKSLQTTKQFKVHHPDPNGTKFEPVTANTTLQDFDPVLLLFEYMKQENFRLIDLFRTLDKDQDNTISREEFKEGFMKININLTDEGLDRLLSRLDVNENDVVDYDELKKGRRNATAKLKNMGSGEYGDRYIEMIHSLKKLVVRARKERLERISSGRTSPRNPRKSPELESPKSRQKTSITDVIEMPAPSEKFLSVTKTV